MGHTWAHIWATWEQQWGMHARIHGPYMGAAMGHACAHTWAIYGGIHGPHGSSNGACMGAYMGHIWGHTWGMHARIHGHIWEQPYRESREEGNNRESLPFLGSGKGIALSLSLPFLTPSSKEGKGREGNPYSIPQRSY